jgi:hypothetical protein
MKLMIGARIRVIVERPPGAAASHVIVPGAALEQAGWEPGTPLDILPAAELAELQRLAGYARAFWLASSDAPARQTITITPNEYRQLRRLRDDCETVVGIQLDGASGDDHGFADGVRALLLKPRGLPDGPYHLKVDWNAPLVGPGEVAVPSSASCCEASRNVEGGQWCPIHGETWRAPATEGGL